MIASGTSKQAIQIKGLSILAKKIPTDRLIDKKPMYQLQLMINHSPEKLSIPIQGDAREPRFPY